MSHPLLRIAAAVWATGVVALLVTRATLLQAPLLSSSETAAWLAVAAMPAAILLFAFRQRSPTIAQVLYDAEHPEEGRRSRP